ncbi:MAG TPA: ABC transporter ATP-binding protein [Verrucomicrobiae bacterium]|jgi:ABC-2 type transport system ATP-binding protein|nr:ABC transporter ATP-binding protein [Verrucomicrobiae bacterium]
MIELRNVTKKFGRNTAVDDLSLTVPAGEIFGLLGHNGAGKSTAIGMMLGQVWPSAGEVKVCGHEVTLHRHNALEKVGAIFEAPAFYNDLSGWRNLEILSSYTAPTPKRRIQEVVDWVGLTARIGSKVKTYSHGMRARLALGQALLPQPALLILDEPGDGLDPEGIHEMRLTIQRLHRELGLTILLSSHLLVEVEQVCLSIAVMNQGRKVFQGAIAETRQARGWVRLRTTNFAEAAKILRESGLITQERDGKFILPAEGVGTDQVVERLVERRQPVFEIAPEEETLESFYLALMKK